MDDMGMREKIINRLEQCTAKSFDCGIGKGCPYERENNCVDVLMRDILALLKEQKPMVMALDAVFQSDAPFWLEYRNPKEQEFNEWIFPFDTELANGKRIGLRGVSACHLPWTKDYGIEWRCWTSHPTDEQMEAMAWDG